MPNRRTVSLIGTSLAAVLAASLGAAAPANADPRTPAYRDYAGVGSVVTATLWDVLTNGRANIAGGAPAVPSVASFDHVGSATIQTKPGVAPIARPGSNDGIDALMASPEQVDFARVPNRPRYEAGVADDKITYLPVARDAVSVVGFNLGYQVSNFSREDLTAIYSCTSAANVTVTGSGASAQISYSGGATVRVIRPMLPTGTGDVRSFFLRAIGVTSPGACVKTSASSAENDARVLTEDGDIVPFLVSSYIAQKNGLTPRTMNDYEHTILSVNGERPLASTAEPQIPPLMPGPLYGRGAYPPGTQRGVFSRDVYNVVRSESLATPLIAALTTQLATPTARMMLNRSGFKNLDYLGAPNRFLPGPYPLD
jgi:hypothetical protein